MLSERNLFLLKLQYISIKTRDAKVGPRYKELRYLGEGAYGVVAEALDTTT